MDADSIAFSPGPPMSTTIGSGSDFPEEASITAKWTARRRPSGRSGFSSTLSAPHRAVCTTPGSRQWLVRSPGDAAGIAALASDTATASDISPAALYDANVRLMETSLVNDQMG